MQESKHKLAKPTPKSALALIRDTRGANYMEYIVLIAVVVLVGIAGWSKFGKAVKGTVESYGSAVEDMKAN